MNGFFFLIMFVYLLDNENMLSLILQFFAGGQKFPITTHLACACVCFF